MEYLQATGNSKEAKGQTNPRDEFVGLRNKLLNFIDLLPLEDDDSDLSKSLCNSFLSTKTAEDAVEIILAESLQVCVCIKMYDVSGFN